MLAGATVRQSKPVHLLDLPSIVKSHNVTHLGQESQQDVLRIGYLPAHLVKLGFYHIQLFHKISHLLCKDFDRLPPTFLCLRPTLSLTHLTIWSAQLYLCPRSFTSRQMSFRPSAPDFRMSSGNGATFRISRVEDPSSSNSSIYSGNQIFISLCDQLMFQIRSFVS